MQFTILSIIFSFVSMSLSVQGAKLLAAGQKKNTNAWQLISISALPTKHLEFSVPAEFHFNGKAPNKIEALSAKEAVAAAKIEIAGNHLTASWSTEVDPCHFKATFYVCDNKNTFCQPQTKEVNCKASAPEKHQGFFPFLLPQMAHAEGPLPEVPFIENDPAQALKLAKEQHRPLLIDFYGIWCPPCNELNETVFNSPEFARASKDFVLLKLDADQATSWSLKSKYNVTGYPTIIFADENTEEISRFVGARTMTVFVAEMSRVAKLKENSLEKLVKLAESGNAGAAFQLGRLYLGRQDFENAQAYLFSSFLHGGKNLELKNALLSATIGVYKKAEDVAGKKRTLRLLQDALQMFPHTTDVFERASDLASLADALGNKELAKSTRLKIVENAQWFLQHKQALKGSEWTIGDLLETSAGTLEELGDLKKAKETFAKGALEYLKRIKAAKLDVNTERAFNLERAYCLWKSGQVAQAEELYQKLESVYPREFTFFFQHAKFLQNAKRLEEALEKSAKALEFSYGDNKLRVADLKARLHKALNQRQEALLVLNQVLSEYKLPTDPTIRTHRYYEKLRALKKEIEESKAL